MKTIYLVIIIHLLAGSSLSAQLWFPSNSEWRYDWGLWTQQGYEVIQTAGDTIIQGQLCQKLNRTLISVDAFNNYQDTSISIRTPYFMYEANDRVFRFQDGDFHLVYDFTMEPEDSLLIRTDLLEDNICEDEVFFVLDSVVTLFSPYETRRMQYGRIMPESSPQRFMDPIKSGFWKGLEWYRQCLAVIPWS
jgi:hypothetical protein